MKWSFKLGRFLGIDVYIHFTFILLLAFLALAYWMPDHDAQAALLGVLFFLAIFLCVVLHEYGHALVARHYGVPTRDITLLPIGGVARLERIPEEPWREFWIAVAGPAVNVVIALLLALALTVGQWWQPMPVVTHLQGNFAERLLMVNLFLVLFNLVPAFPMDGGRVLRSLLALRMGFVRATSVSASLGQGIAFLFGFWGLFSNPLLILIALFVWVGAGQEASQAQMRSALHGVPVEQAMITDFRWVTPQDSLARAVDLVLSGSQPDFPVLEDGHVVGILTRKDLVAALAKGSPAMPIEEVMRREFLVLRPEEALEEAVTRTRESDLPLTPVVRDDQIVGMLTMENVSEFILIRTALNVSHKV